MPKTPKFIVDMKSHPRSPKHGNRKPVAQAHGNPVDGAGAGEPIRTSLPAAIWRTSYAGVPITRVATIPVTQLDPKVRASQLKPMQDMMYQQMQKLMSWGDVLHPRPPEIPHVGIRAGEIIGWRVWWVNHDGRLRSFVRDAIFWEPDEAMTGDINKCIHVSFKGFDRFGGVYSFNNLQGANREYYQAAAAIKSGERPGESLVGIVLGTAKLWGEVVEHEGGYRASFAKPHYFLETYYWDKKPSRDPQELYFGETK